jgi:hypothetical protein
MGVRYSLKRLFLRGIKWDADTSSITLLQALEAVAKARWEDIKDGRVISSTGQGGAQVAFSFPSGIDPHAVAELASEMLDRYEAATVLLGESPTDDEIFIEMMSGIGRITATRPDFSL